MTQSDTDNTVEQAIDDLKELLRKSDQYGSFRSEKNFNSMSLVTDLSQAARKHLILLEQIAAGKVRICPVDPTNIMQDKGQLAWENVAIDDWRVRPGSLYKAMLSAAGTYNWTKGTFDE